MTPRNNVSEIERVGKTNGDDDEQDRSHENKKPTPIVAACLGFGFSDGSRPLVYFRIWHLCSSKSCPREVANRCHPILIQPNPLATRRESRHKSNTHFK